MRACFPLILACVGLACAISAQEPESARTLELRLLRGEDKAVLAEAMKALEAEHPAGDLLCLGLAASRNIGQLAEEERFARALSALDGIAPRGRIALATYLAERGRREEALKLLEPLVQPLAPLPTDRPAFSLRAAAALADMHASLGHSSIAEALREQVVEEARRIVVREAQDLVALGEVYRAFDGAKEAEGAFVEAQRTLEKARKSGAQESALEDWRPTLALARLYLEDMHLEADAVRECESALRLRSGLAEAFAVKGRAELAWQKDSAADDSFKRALAVHAAEKTARAHAIRAGLGVHLAPDIVKSLDEALARWPVEPAYLGLDLARQLFTQGESAFRKRLAEVQKLVPTSADPWLSVVDLLSDQRRWQEALVLAEEAVRLHPESAPLCDALARLALYLGEDERARAALKAAAEAERFSHVKRRNMAEFLRVNGRYYEDVATEHLILRLARRERAVLEPVLGPFAERSLKHFIAKYGFTPAGIAGGDKLRVEVLLSSGDLSARTFALPRPGVLGFCFGPLVTMLSPGADGSENFSWARTLHHELAHSFALGLSKGRVPKWLTEGLSTCEERAENPAWDRHFDRELQDALHSDELIPVRAFDAAFGTPRAVFAYYQAGLLAEALVKQGGMERMTALLRLLGEDKAFWPALHATCQIDADGLEALMRETAAAHTASMRRIPRLVGKALVAATTADATPDAVTLIRLTATLQDAGPLRMAEANAALERATAKAGADEPRVLFLTARQAALARDDKRALGLVTQALQAGLDDAQAHELHARLALNAGDSPTAEKSFRAAIAAFPNNADRKGPRVQLARILLARGATEEALLVLEAHLAIDAEDDDARTQILKLLSVKGAQEKILAHAEARMLLLPLLAEVHLVRGRALRSLARNADAEGALRIGLACKMEAPEEADLLGELGLTLLALERREEALESAKKAEALVPGHAIAKDVRRRAGAR